MPSDPQEASAGPARHLRSVFASNSSVLIATTIANAVLRFGSNLLLTRLLAPEAFGIMLIVFAVSGVVNLMTETGIPAYVVRGERAAEPRQLDTMWTISVVRGFAIAGLIALLAPLIARGLGQPEAVGALRVTCLIFAIGGLRSLAPFVAIRANEQRRNAVVEFAAYAAHLPFLVGLVWMTGSYWGLVYGTLVGSAFSMIATYLFYAKPIRRIALDLDVVRDLWRFARFILASSLTTMVVLQFDKLFVAGAFPLALAGLYALAINLTTTAETMIRSYFSTIYLPQVSERLRRGSGTSDTFYEPMRVMRPVLLFGCAGGVTFGVTFFEVLFPPDYHQAGVFFAVLALKTLVTVYCSSTAEYLIANEMAAKRFRGDLIRVVWLPVLAVVGFSQFGIWGLLFAVVLTDLPTAVYQYVVLGRLGLLRLSREVVPLVAIAGGAGVGQLASLVLSAIS